MNNPRETTIRGKESESDIIFWHALAGIAEKVDGGEELLKRFKESDKHGKDALLKLADALEKEERVTHGNIYKIPGDTDDPHYKEDYSGIAIKDHLQKLLSLYAEAKAKNVDLFSIAEEIKTLEDHDLNKLNDQLSRVEGMIERALE